MADKLEYFPNANEGLYELWHEDTGFIVKLPQYAARLTTGEYLQVDDTEYEVERIEHTLISVEDWPGPIPPASEGGFDRPTIKVIVSTVV